jgi:hypothetical protein
MILLRHGYMLKAGTALLLAPQLRTTCLAGMAFIVALSGCASEEDGRVKVYPVSGKVLVNGKPAEGAELIFYGATPEMRGPGTVSAEGVTDENGVFHLGSYGPNDGAPAGKFNVVVIWREPIPDGVDQERFQAKDRLNNRYATPESSGLTAEVPERGIELPPFELK